MSPSKCNYSACNTVSKSSKEIVVKTISYPARNLSGRAGDDSPVKMARVALTMASSAGTEMGNSSSGSINGTLLILLSGLSSGVTLAGASVVVNGVTYNLAASATLAGDPVLTIPQSVVSSLDPGSMVSVALRFQDPLFGPIGYSPLLFSDPIGG